MTVRALLWTYKPRKDGKCNIKIYIHKGGKKKYRSTEYFAREEDWDKDSYRLKRSAPLASKINADLARLEEEARGQLIGVNNSLLQLIDGFIIDCKAGRGGLKPGTWKQFISHLNHLRGYCEEQGKSDLTFADIDMTFYAQFCAYLREHGCNEAGVGKHIKHLKRFMQLGLDRKLHTNMTFREKAFHAAKVRPKDKIFLTAEEIEAIAHSDRGSQYGSQAYIDLLAKHQVQICMAKSGPQNACAERINLTIKDEFLKHWKIPDLTILKRLTRKAVNYYNHKRKHNHLGRLTPIAFLEAYPALAVNDRPIVNIPILNS
jgi:hypothetical protein